MEWTGVLTDPPTGAQPLRAGGAPPATIDQVTQKLREANPCPLIDPAALLPFGPAEFPTIAPYLESCQATITTAGGNTDVRVIFREPGAGSNLGELTRQVGNVTIFRGGEYTIGTAPACRYFLVSADQPMVEILAVSYETPVTIDVCAVAEAATDPAADELAEDGITYTPNRTSDYVLAHSDACALLDDAAPPAVASLKIDSARTLVRARLLL